MIYGARVSLEVAFIATALIVLIGVTLGLIAGYYRGWVDTLLTRAMDVLLAFPVLLLAIGLGVACSGADGCLGGADPAGPDGRDLRDRARQLALHRAHRPRPGAVAAREGVRRGGALARRLEPADHLPRDPPNLVAPIIVYATILIPQNILFEAALSFLGVGVDPEHAELGRDDRRRHVDLRQAWWFMIFPGLALAAHRAGLQPLGDGLQDALNPRTAK